MIVSESGVERIVSFYTDCLRRNSLLNLLFRQVFPIAPWNMPYM